MRQSGRHKNAWAWTAVLWLWLLTAVGPARGQALPPESFELTAQATYTFGQAIQFELQMVNQPAVESVTLFVSTPQFNTTYSVPFVLDAAAGDTAQLAHTLDLSQIRLQPFTELTYWWTFLTTDGDLYETAPAVLAYNDDTFEWQQRTRDNVTVYWVTEEMDLGQVALDVVDQSLPQIREILPVESKQPVRVYLYPSVSDFQAALRLTGQDGWVGGHADPALGVIMLPAENPRTAVVDLRRRIPHELSHLLLYRTTQPQYDTIPRWFDEGLAAMFETVPNPNYEPALEQALENNSLLPFESLCQRFPSAVSDDIYLAYAQSEALVSYIRATYGEATLRDFTTAFADGATCESAVTRVLDISLNALVDEWRTTNRPVTNTIWRQNGLWLLLLGGGFGLMMMLVFKR